LVSHTYSVREIETISPSHPEFFRPQTQILHKLSLHHLPLLLDIGEDIKEGIRYYPELHIAVSTYPLPYISCALKRKRTSLFLCCSPAKSFSVLEMEDFEAVRALEDDIKQQQLILQAKENLLMYLHIHFVRRYQDQYDDYHFQLTQQPNDLDSLNFRTFCDKELLQPRTCGSVDEYLRDAQEAKPKLERIVDFIAARVSA
ncbi:unnamed protein product, partial [Choristocarpus tenellus]